MASASGYNHHRFARSLLKKSRKWEASLTVELFPAYWRFQHSSMNFQYNSGPMMPFLMALRAQVIPASLIPFLYDIRPPVSFYDGCLVVELHDFRKTPEQKSRVVMRPAAEALAQTIDVMLERKGVGRDEGLALELESRIIAATSPPLYLGTSILASRNAAVAIALTTPAAPNVSAQGTYRNPASTGIGDEKSESEIIRKMLHAGERTGTFQPTWSVLRAKEHLENQRIQAAQAESQQAQAGSLNPAGNSAVPAPQAGTAPTNPAGGGADKPKKPKKKRVAEDSGEAAGAAGTSAPAPKKKKKVEGDKKKDKGSTGGKKKVEPKE